MIGFRGLGMTCPAGQLDAGGFCVDDLTGALAAADANTQLYTGVPIGPNASNSINITLPATGQTFGQWVSANSTLLLVAFGAVGALVALTRIGK